MRVFPSNTSPQSIRRPTATAPTIPSLQVRPSVHLMAGSSSRSGRSTYKAGGRGRNHNDAHSSTSNMDVSSDSDSSLAFLSSQSSSSSEFSDSPSLNVTKAKKNKSHARKKPEGHIPRPPNAFILFRSDFIAKHKRDLSISPSPSTPPSNNASPTSSPSTPDLAKNQQSISRIAGVVWKALPESERKIWFARAEEAKSAHSQQFPGYQFAPTSATAMYDIDETGGVGPIRRKRVVRKGRQEEQLKAQAQICQVVADAIVKRRVRPHERATPSDGEEPKTPDLENGSRVISVSPPNRMESDVVESSGNRTPANAPSNPSTPPQQVAPVLQPPQPPISPSPTPSIPPSTFSRQSSFASFASRPVAYGFSRNAPTAPVEPLFRTPQVELAATSMSTSSSGWVSGRMPANGIRPVIGDDRWSIRPSLLRTDNPRRPLIDLDGDDDDD